MKKTDKKPTLNDEALLAYFDGATGPLSKRDLAKAFGLHDSEKIHLKRMLKLLLEQGAIEQTRTRTYQRVQPGASGMPTVIVARVSEITLDGDVLAEALDTAEGAALGGPLYLDTSSHAHEAPGVGDRVLVRVGRLADGSISGHIMRRLDDTPERTVLGRVAGNADAMWLQPVNRREKNDYELIIPPDRKAEVQMGMLVEATIMPTRNLKRPRAELKNIIGDANDPRAISLIAMHEHGLTAPFPQAVIDECFGMRVPPLGAREDLRALPLVTIDGADARDFDDAVFAEETDEGFHLIVAIADVSAYVTEGSALDREAFRRGNSTYFPDRVVPMLPEALSNDLCSLRPREDRACLAMHLWIDRTGRLIRHTCKRALMRSVARFTYEQVQAAMDGVVDHVTDGLVEPVIRPLYGAYDVLNQARQKRGALDLAVPERQIILDDKGNMTGIRPRTRLDSHKLIEEFMILANVAAAEALERKGSVCIYRIHDTPSSAKIDMARSFLEGFKLVLAKGQAVKPVMFNTLLHKVEGQDFAPLVHEVVLRAQSQAVYHPDNIGHFGLALEKYAHFTSPIRRYADLFVHRALIAAYGLGEGGLSVAEASRAADIAEHISFTERTSMEAERSAIDRFTASWLAQHVGEVFAGRISGVTRFGLFVALTETGADGLVPIRSLPTDYYIHAEEHHALIGRRTGRVFRLCAPVQVRIMEADRLTGSSVFELVDAEGGAEIPGFAGKTLRPPKGRGHHYDAPKSGNGKGKNKGKPDRFSKDKRGGKPRGPSKKGY